ncbi:hypothetical protein [Pseudonocardia sp. TRM90224]|uniref:hypothetical protein n=1 Tax=Pseudonocardia sp. TRM90224 TaxID=2812678 RepID=UPI001E29BB25|nr:hypothetical protein [Pseudonocardia sp. TRM90224]
MIQVLKDISDKMLELVVPTESADAAACQERYVCEYIGTHSRLIKYTTSCTSYLVCTDCC